jgi:ParB family chromosome partitioning protein
MHVAKKRGLGSTGLGALLKGSDVDLSKDPVADGDLKQLPVEFLKRGKYQPRRDMDPDALEELAESIRQQGIMQPIVVRSIGEDSYEIIAGERRWRAAQIADLDKVPAIIRDVEDDAAVAMALIENIQRENLNAMEEATALQRLQDEFELTQGEVAEAVGKSRSTVTNLLRLINLTDEVKLMLEHGDLEMGHGRAMLSLDQERQIQVARQVESKSLSVRQTEALVRRLLEEKPAKKVEKSKPDADILRLQEDLSEKVGAEVSVQHSGKGKGKLVIKYNSLDELDGILTHIK